MVLPECIPSKDEPKDTYLPKDTVHPRLRAKPVDRVPSGREANVTAERRAFIERMMRVSRKPQSFEQVLERLEQDRKNPAYF
jgi:hypothetical protein